MDERIKELLELTKRLTEKNRIPVEKNQNAQEQDTYFLKKKAQFEVDSKVMAYCIPRGSFSSNILSLDFKKK